MLQNQRPKGFSQFTIYLRAFTAIAYFVMGIYFFMRRSLLPVSDGVAMIMSFLIIIYGIFRGWGTYNAYKSNS
jgi:hypothetical protein